MTEAEQTDRIRTAMVLYELERELGRYVSDLYGRTALDSTVTAPIIERERERGMNIDPSNPREIIAASYLDEVLTIARNSSRDETAREHLTRLRELCDVLEVFDIRNAIAHPNRPFPSTYWHRAAAIATDPVIEKLGLSKVRGAFIAAASGRLDPPPADWVSAPTWILPNNLPEAFDHDLTGLFGRPKEKTELLRLLQNPRALLVAVVGPGGLGKTALVLEVLRDVVTEIKSRSWCDRVIFVSSKTEELTPRGVEKISASKATLDAVQEEILANLTVGKGEFVSALEPFASERVLLCLDNVETLLRDNADAFSGFYQALPAAWRVMVTSRVTVDGAMTLTLRGLAKDAAIALTATYSRRRAADVPSDRFNELVSGCDFNPLAIRLTVDAFLTGKDLTTATGQTHIEVVEYAYDNLISSLSESARLLLELLFVSGAPLTRDAAAGILEWSVDQVAESFQQLSRTSLVTRDAGESEEVYSLTSSLRDLLLVQPADPTARAQIQRRIRELRTAVTAIERVHDRTLMHPLADDFAPEGTAPDIQVALFQVRRVTSRNPVERAAVARELEKLNVLMQAHVNHPLLHRARGICFLTLGDRERAKSEFRKASEFELDPPSALRLANILREDKQLKEAVEWGKRLFDNGWNDPQRSNATAAGHVAKAFLLPLIFLGESDDALEYTQSWRHEPSQKAVLGGLHVMALRNSIELDYGRDIEGVDSTLAEATKELTALIADVGYPVPVIVEGMKLIEQLAFRAEKDPPPSREMASLIIRFVSDHLPTVASLHRDFTLDSPVVQTWLSALSRLEGSEPISRLGQEPPDREIDSSRPDQVDQFPVTVYHIPHSKRGEAHPTFLFASDAQDHQYFVHRDVFDGSDSEWNGIRQGVLLLVQPAPASLRGAGRAWPVKYACIMIG